MKVMNRGIAAIAALLLSLSCGAAASSTEGYAALIRQVAPSVVTVMVEEKRVSPGQRAAELATSVSSNDISVVIRRLLTGNVGNPDDDRPTGALGSGFVIRADGLIVTNRHVVNGALKVKVRLPDGRDFPAKILGADAVTDIALLKVDGVKLAALRLGSSQSVSVGDAVIAIGNPYGLGQSVSAGIISARARALEDDPYIDFLQTDAAINHGNSGGPLMTPDGLVVSVTLAIFSPIGQLESKGHVERGYLGISVQEVTPILAKALGMKAPAGALISSVDPAGPAHGTFAPGDVLMTIGSNHVTFRNMSKITARLLPDALATMTLRRDVKTISVAMKIGRLPEPPSDPALESDQDTWVPALQLSVANTTEDIRKAVKAGDEPSGLIVTQLRPYGPGSLAGLKIGDVITHIGGKQVVDVRDVKGTPAPTLQAPLLVRVVRDGNATFVAITGQTEL
jgi:serine protease Do